ncbi:PqqD family peptide modification chaperone [Lactococcus termiticola]|uniref:Coenzyme PQQ synthesis protein D (PqqD) n=1 Tax=Lactococcus termiticola TaxID=2169526 RepID=A0A2R5HHE4_9LACT|nr:PqqD family peptide modification chaperone [Lactococcus termiticola]GBG97483.1 hypothetical protein NtB2_01629 [Lactococcus termiticola]
MNKIDDTTLEMVFIKKEGLLTEEDEAGHILIIKPQDHWSQRLMRKIGIRIPEVSKTELDDYGSLVFKQINGQNTIKAIGENLAETYDEASEYLYDRLLLYINHLENVEHWIVKVEK